MKRLLIIVGVLIATLAPMGLAQEIDLTGAWQGVIGPGAIDLDIQVEFSGTADELAATLAIPAQGLFDFPLGEVELDGDQVRFVMPGVPGDPVFEGQADADRIEGTFTQGGQAFDFFLERDLDPDARGTGLVRPQEPQPPYPYREEEVSYASQDVTLAGTLTLPEGEGPFAAALLITGSGPQDRDEELYGHKPFLVIADDLTRAGLAVLRVDDRGVGGSTGLDADASFADLVEDALAGVAFLAAHPEIDADRVGLIGHSQGGYVAPGVVAEGGQVAFVVMLAGPAVHGFDVLVLQNERIIGDAMRADPSVDEALIEETVAAQLSYLADMRDLLGADDFEGAAERLRAEIIGAYDSAPEDQRPSVEILEQIVELQVAGNVNRSMASFMNFDPQPYLRELRVPVLAIFGDMDVQVDAQQSVGPLRELLVEAGNPDFSVVTFAGLNHLMQPAITGSVDEYPLIETTMDPIVLETMRAWLVTRFVRR